VKRQKVAEEACIGRVAGYGEFYWKVGRHTSPAGRRSLVAPAGRIHSVCCDEEMASTRWMSVAVTNPIHAVDAYVNLEITTARKTSIVRRLTIRGTSELAERTAFSHSHWQRRGCGLMLTGCCWRYRRGSWASFPGWCPGSIASYDVGGDRSWTSPRKARSLQSPDSKRSGDYSSRKGRDGQKKKIAEANEKRKKGNIKKQKMREWMDKREKGRKGGTLAPRGVESWALA